MLKQFTTEEFAKITNVFMKHLEFLLNNCAGILKNEINQVYESPQDRLNQKNIKENLDNLINHIFDMDLSLRLNNSEKLRTDLVYFLEGIREIFSASLNLHETHEGVNAYEQFKGRHLVAMQGIVEACENAKRLIVQDHSLKGPVGKMSDLTESANEIIKGIAQLSGLKVKKSKIEKLLNLEGQNLDKQSPVTVKRRK